MRIAVSIDKWPPARAFWNLLVLASAISGCGASVHDTATTVPTVARTCERADAGHAAGCNSATVLAAAESNIRFSGSCLVRSAGGTRMVCQDFWNFPGSELASTEQNSCVVSGAKWSESACPEADRLGGCRSKVEENGAYVVQWYYIASLAAEAKEICTRDGSSTWLD